jgi:hypothetical protein
MNESYLDISEYFIMPHCRKKWKKRWLHYTPKGEKRVYTIEEAIKGKKKLVRAYIERGTLRVTDFKYEFIVDTSRKVIITMYAYQRKGSTKEYKRKKEMLKYDDY